MRLRQKMPPGRVAGTKNAQFFREKPAPEAPARGMLTEGNDVPYVAASPAVTAPGPAGKDAESPAVSVVPAYTSTPHHE